MSWVTGPMVAFDTETTGTDVEHDRIVTAALVAVDADGRIRRERCWFVDPGVEIPAEATAIHGISTERARAEGSPAGPAVEEIAELVASVLAAGTPLVVMNARYDLSLLDRECRRHGVASPAERLAGRHRGTVIDPLVLDKHADRHRKGKRSLTALCAHYGVELQDAHDARADAVAAARTARRVGAGHPELALLGPSDLHALQIRAAADQAASLQAYLRRSDPQARVESAWPWIPRPRGA
ncbi:exonuclease domain-containing protein [Streptomyces sp. BI20]|uniref:exonuclease domain-containing protein n=1 Tax=Streptomyces sp. BI20 TaxID=3403460 RepID=UPI003C788C91